jgi:hypothetical protein
MSGAKLKGPAEVDDELEPAPKESLGLISLEPPLLLLLLEAEMASLTSPVIVESRVG